MRSLLLLAALVSVGAGWQLRQAEEEQDPLAMFVSIDEDGSRTMSAAEMKAFFADNMPKHVKAVNMMIATYDENGDGELNLKEAVAMNMDNNDEEATLDRYMFKKMADQDGDGAITKHEYHTVLMNMGMGADLSEKYTTEDFAQYDADGDGQMKYEEWIEYNTQDKDEEIKRNWFRAIDKDGDGEITIAEQIMTWEALGAHEMADIELIRPETAKWDANKDGRLNFEEWKEQP